MRDYTTERRRKGKPPTPQTFPPSSTSTGAPLILVRSATATRRSKTLYVVTGDGARRYADLDAPASAITALHAAAEQFERAGAERKRAA